MNASTAPAASPPSSEPIVTPAAADSLSVHARRTLRTRLRGQITAMYGAGVAFLLRLRRQAGEAPGKVEDADDRAGAGPDRSESRRDASTDPAESPAADAKPSRRLRTSLIYAGVLLVGGLGGGALAYILFQQQLDQMLSDKLRQEAARSKQARPSAEIQKAFENEQAKRIKAEATLAESSKSMAETQKKLDAAEKQLAALHVADGSNSGRLEILASRTSSDYRSHALKSGDCTLDAKNVGALKNCIADFNR